MNITALLVYIDDMVLTRDDFRRNEVVAVIFG